MRDIEGPEPEAQSDKGKSLCRRIRSTEYESSGPDEEWKMCVSHGLMLMVNSIRKQRKQIVEIFEAADFVDFNLIPIKLNLNPADVIILGRQCTR